MKNVHYLFLLITQIFFAQNGFEKGNALYQKGNYPAAVLAYESVLNTNQHSSELYFNLANTYYKLNKVAPAIYYYEKALVLNPSDQESLNNLKFAHKRTIDEIKVVPKVGFTKLLRDFTGIYQYNTWGWVSIGLATLFFVFFLIYYFSQSTVWKRMFFSLLFVAFFLMLFTLCCAFFEKKYFDSERPAIVFAEMAHLKKEPKEGGKSLFLLHEGTKVYVQQALGKWKKIHLTDGTEGWIESNTIKEVKELRQ